MALGETLLVNELATKLSPWMKNPPDYADVSEAYTKRGELQAKRAKLEREIRRVENNVVLTADRPRSNDTRMLKLEATYLLQDELAELDAQLAIVENRIRLLEFRKEMFKTASYQHKQTYEL